MPALRHVTWISFMRLLRLAPKVIMANMLNFKPIFECSLLKTVGVCASKPWSISSTWKFEPAAPLRGRNMVFHKSRIGWVGGIHHLQSGLIKIDFFYLNRIFWFLLDFYTASFYLW